MNHYIIDASVAVKWFFREEELAKQADTLLHSRTGILFPDYFYIEMNSVFTKLARKRFLTVEEVRQMNKALNALPADILEVRNYRDLSMEWSLEMNIGYYDCLYVTPACILKIPLVTADKRLYHAFCKSEWSPYVIWLGNLA